MVFVQPRRGPPPPVPSRHHGTPIAASPVGAAEKPQHRKPPVPSHHHGVFLTHTPPCQPPPAPPRRRSNSDPANVRANRPSECPCDVAEAVSEALLAQIRAGVMLRKTVAQPHSAREDALVELLHNVKLRPVGPIERPTRFEPPADSIPYHLAIRRRKMGEESDNE